jgi:hypothetical protein
MDGFGDTTYLVCVPSVPLHIYALACGRELWKTGVVKAAVYVRTTV